MPYQEGLARYAIRGSGCPPLLMRTLREENLGRGDGIYRRVSRAAAACSRQFCFHHCCRALEIGVVNS